MDYRFNGFVINFESLKLEINNKQVDLDKDSFQLLMLLIESSPDVCSKHKLIESLWSERNAKTFSLSKLVTDIRNIFLQSGYKGPLIETIHGQGYKLDEALSQQLNRTKDETREFSNILNKKVKVTKKWQYLAYSSLTVLCLSLIHFTMIQVRGVDESSEQIEQLIYSEPHKALGRILWVDDNPKNNLNEKRFFEKNKIGVYTTTSTEEALKLLSLYNYQVVISDMGRNNDPLAGLKLLKKMRSSNIKTPFFMYTWISSDALIKELENNGSQGFTIEAETLYSQILPIFKK